MFVFFYSPAEKVLRVSSIEAKVLDSCLFLFKEGVRQILFALFLFVYSKYFIFVFYFFEAIIRVSCELKLAAP